MGLGVPPPVPTMVRGPGGGRCAALWQFSRSPAKTGDDGTVQENLEAARAAAPDIAPGTRPLFLPALGAGMWLDMLRREGYDLFEGRLQRPPGTPLGYQLRLHWARLRQSY